MTRHRQVTIEWDDMKADVPEILAPLILELWKRDIWVLAGYQCDHTGTATIEFMSACEAASFLTSITADPDDEDVPYLETLHARVLGFTDSEKDWEYCVELCDLNLEQSEVDEERMDANIVYQPVEKARLTAVV